MKTVKVDARQRVRLPDIRPLQVLSYHKNGDGSVTLRPLKVESRERFPRGSLKKYITAETNREMLQLLKGCVQGPLE